ncbi:hypothetical protein Taro_048940 [Colocasia esculenta]|uniref:WPP domain-containing protein n=1 Tax=Colocasia esculenta TaxID=4460 RepID=A0A843X9I5_COLES|nr:hypothetical protein [Colocasia esculenta]
MATTAAEHLEQHSSPEQREDPPEGARTASNAADGCHADDAAATEEGEEEEEEEEEELLTLPIWPPSQWAREAVIQSLTESLSSPSSLFEKYGPVPLEEAAAAARRIEQEAFAAVSPPAPAAGGGGDDDDGMETLNAYSKEISKRVVGFCQTRRAALLPPTPAPPVGSAAPAASAAAAAAAPASEEAPPIKSEVSLA